jgi:hypothetical protein
VLDTQLSGSSTSDKRSQDTLHQSARLPQPHQQSLSSAHLISAKSLAHHGHDSQSLGEPSTSAESNIFPPGNQAALLIHGSMSSSGNSATHQPLIPSTPNLRFALVEMESSPLATPPMKPVPPSPTFDTLVKRATERRSPARTLLNAVIKPIVSPKADHKDVLSIPVGNPGLESPIKHFDRVEGQESRIELETDVERPLNQLNPSPLPIITPPRSPTIRKRRYSTDILGTSASKRREVPHPESGNVSWIVLIHQCLAVLRLQIA